MTTALGITWHERGHLGFPARPAGEDSYNKHDGQTYTFSSTAFVALELAFVFMTQLPAGFPLQ